MPSPRLDEPEFKRRFLTQFKDPAFDPLNRELARVADVAWDAYYNSRKSPRTRKAGAGFADPEYDLVIVAQSGTVVEQLDLSRLSSEYGRKILPCKACASQRRPPCAIGLAPVTPTTPWDRHRIG
jgi:hypothetical protein